MGYSWTNKIEVVVNADSAPKVALCLTSLVHAIDIKSLQHGDDILFQIHTDESGKEFIAFALGVGMAIERGKGIIKKLQIN